MIKKITDYSTEEIGKYINELETEQAKYKLEQQIKQEELANKEQLINLTISFISERTRLEVMAMFGFIKLDT